MFELPTWFLILALFLPRVALLVAYFTEARTVASYLTSAVPIGMAVLVPRVLVVVLIFAVSGWSWWLIPHSVGIMAAYGFGGSQA